MNDQIKRTYLHFLKYRIKLARSPFGIRCFELNNGYLVPILIVDHIEITYGIFK